MAAGRMSPSMQANVQAQIHLLIAQCDAEFARALVSKPSDPMTTLTKTVDFRIATPTDGTREFTFVCSVTEQSTPGNTPTTGHDISTK